MRTKLFLLSLLTVGLTGVHGDVAFQDWFPSFAQPSLRRVQARDLPSIKIDDSDQGDWEGGSRAGLKLALTRQKERCSQQDGNAAWNFAGTSVTRDRYCTQTLNWFLNKIDHVGSLAELYESAKSELEWYQSTGKTGQGDVQFTGYYYPVYHAKKVPDAQFRYPVYSKPDDLVQVNIGGEIVWRRKVGARYVNYYTREEIVKGALAGKGLELGYVANPVDAYMLEVQGSGALLIESGAGNEIRRIVNYAAQNGQPYVSLGKLMRAAGVPEEYISLQGIRKYFTEVHPEDWEKFSNQNPSYVFFQNGSDGPFGASGVVLTPKHSIAIDTKVFPLGAIGLIQTERPIKVKGDEAVEWKPFSQFVVAQDTGGAIQTPGRVDVYWGEGEYAEVAAGRTDRMGTLFFALVSEKPASLTQSE